jgi:hypothetical protein
MQSICHDVLIRNAQLQTDMAVLKTSLVSELNRMQSNTDAKFEELQEQLEALTKTTASDSLEINALVNAPPAQPENKFLHRHGRGPTAQQEPAPRQRVQVCSDGGAGVGGRFVLIESS